jgi:DNA-binding NarL/FixJ family response regulator
MKRISVLLTEDHTVVREGLRALLEASGEVDVVGEADNGHDAIKLTRRLRPAILLIDIAMSGLNGMEATRQIRKEVPETRIIVLSAHGDDAYVTRMIHLGVAGYLLKQTSANHLLEAIREVAKGNSYFSPALARRRRTLSGSAKDSLRPQESAKAGLTSREVEVLQLIAEGYANKQVASALNISIKTVEKHRQSLMERLNIHNTAGLTRYAISAGVVENIVQLTIVPDTD